MKKAFTVVEIMIVVVIIGLLAAMAIPAFQKVKQASIEKQAKILNITPDEYKYRNGMMNDEQMQEYRLKSRQSDWSSTPAPAPAPIQTIPEEVIIDGRHYRLVK